MRTLQQISAIPECGVVAVQEGNLTRIFFDFTDSEHREEEEIPADIKACESIDVKGRSYGEIISAIINDHYSADENQALQANHELAKDPDSEISDEKRAEYLAEYAAYQNWRTHAKEIARITLSIIEGAPVAE